ncbi:SUMF1/EgtB/PvdO family nonheme iron enzyme [Fluviicola sp.]|jgi:formylglycine-generating enzyme required for sulfatase activity|uniref:type IX secretion system lipoprotein PorK/GldK n=1 Tax=Fluviicola sp. TaxID=1917219 RepID=UPI00282236E3|nr:SUMF1/EgtB/PvdO family nonheme iron enzyme [Fluviicola sp.]MDR0801113.1 formylglycine-generating enzyme family protein [Fluviicola sp.]
MKKLLFIGLIGALIASCSTRSGYLTGALGRKVYQPEIPLGMVYVPSGSYIMGEDDQDVPFLHQTRAKTVSVQAFYIDQTEITNNEYRQFVEWVRDSMARERIYAGLEDDEDASRYINYSDMYFDEGALEMVEFEPSDRDVNRAQFSLNWDRRFAYDDPDLMPLLADMYYPQPERFFKRREFDTRKLNFKYYWIDLREAAKRGRIDIVNNGVDKDGNEISPEHRDLNTPPHPFTEEPQGLDKDMGYFNKKGQNNAIRGHENRQRFIIDEEINVYPDTLVWVRDFTYSFHDPMTNMYFWHPAYDNYPVIGITWVQAKAFSVWRTQLLNNWLQAMGDLFVNDFRLPTEAEWERAARGDLSNSPYPWGGPYIRNQSGCFLGNFKPMRGRYFEDGGFQTVKAYSYNPNGWGLYCMAGNVSEWCETAYDESMYEFSHDLNTEYRYDAMDWDPPAMKRKVIRGGSWKDVGYYLQTSTRTYEYQDTAKSYIGFRNVSTHLGRGGRDFSKEGGEEIRSDIQLR